MSTSQTTTTEIELSHYLHVISK